MGQEMEELDWFEHMLELVDLDSASVRLCWLALEYTGAKRAFHQPGITEEHQYSLFLRAMRARQAAIKLLLG
jgi:hypothetical protein